MLDVLVMGLLSCIVCIPLVCVYCVVVEYNADSVPTFQSPMITGVVANVLCMYTVLRVLLCYRIVLPCYRWSVTESLNHSSGFRISVFQFENGMHRDVIGYWLHPPSSHLLSQSL